ncbi:MAG: phage holin family protein [Roseibacillus sp.]
MRTRLQLVSIETQEALAHLKGKLAPLLVILVCAVGSYFLLLTALVSFIGKLLGLIGKHPLLGWEVAALIVAGIHIVIIFAMKKKVTGKLPAPLFEYSRAELERDREWIQEHNPTSKNS